MDERAFLLIAFLIQGFLPLAKCSIADNEIPSLEDSTSDVPISELIKGGFNVNRVVDGILVATRSAIEAGGATQVKLDPVEADLDISLKIATLTAHVNLVNGTLRALNSIERRGDARVVPRIILRELDVVATLGLKTAVAEYYYYLQVLGIHPNGNLTVDVRDNAVTVKFALSFDRQGCHLNLTELKMTKLGDVDVTLTGLYPFDTWSSRIATQLMENLDGRLAETIETTLRYYIDQETQKLPCAKKRSPAKKKILNTPE